MNAASRISIVLGFVCVFLVPAPTFAQRSLFGRSQNSLISLASNEAVQKDLGCSAYEVNKLREFQDEYRAASQKELSSLGISFQNFRSITDAQREAAGLKMAEVTARLNKEYLPKLQRVLVPDQMKRLRQIQIQASGVDAMLEGDLAAELVLSEEQKKSLTAIRDEYSSKQQGLFRGEGDQQERNNKIRELSEERDRKVSELLTSDQNAKLITLQGEPFDVSQLRSRRGN